MKITRELDHEDQIITVRRRGRKIIVETQRGTIARSVKRQIVDALSPPESAGTLPCVGFEAPQ